MQKRLRSHAARTVKSKHFTAKSVPSSEKASVKWKQSRPSKRKLDKEPTAFQRSVYELISTIPAGKVSTYGAVAKRLESSPRAVGNALRNNPFAPQVPCHRVVASTRELYGFDGQSGSGAPKLEKKRNMLVEEGVKFESEMATRVAEESMFFF